MPKQRRISYGFIFLTIVLVAWLNLATPLLTALFSYFALEKLNLLKSKWFSVIAFMVLVSAIFYGFVLFLKHAFVALPDIASTAVPAIIDYAQKHDVELPFTDVDTLKILIIDSVKDQLKYLGNFAKIATKEFVFLMIGFVVAISVFLDSKVDLDRGHYPVQNNLYSLCCDEIAARFRLFYSSFATVMGAQMIISVINTVLTTIFIAFVSLPYAPVIIGVTFLCGLLPIIGNIISNSVIVGIAFTISPKMAIAALIFLVALHKLEYFLNSKIIGHRIRNPVWLTLLGLILGERLMGIPGMILAPVILNYVKVETSQIEVAGPKLITGPESPIVKE